MFIFSVLLPSVSALSSPVPLTRTPPVTECHLCQVVHDLMLHGASRKVLEEETRKLEAFESVVFKVRRDEQRADVLTAVSGVQAMGAAF